MASKVSRPSRAKVAPVAVRIVEAVGSSRRGWDAAVTDAVRGAKDEAPGAVAVEVARLWADLDSRSGIRLYRAAVKIAYRQTLMPPARARPAAKTKKR